MLLLRITFLSYIVFLHSLVYIHARKPGAYHLGYTTDLRYLLSIVKERNPSASIYLSGFSLGGNVSLKLLGELGEEAKTLNIKGCAVTSVPFDPIASQGKLDKGFNRLAYSEVT